MTAACRHVMPQPCSRPCMADAQAEHGAPRAPSMEHVQTWAASHLNQVAYASAYAALQDWLVPSL